MAHQKVKVFSDGQNCKRVVSKILWDKIFAKLGSLF